jgi:PAS domain S-box-containing protein
MRLFARTFNAFISVIILQAILVILLVSGSITRSQEEDSKRELKAEALSVYDNFNAWKRALWGTIVDLSKSEELGHLVASQRSGASGEPLDEYLRKAALQAGAEFLIIKDSRPSFSAVRPLTEKPIPRPKAQDFFIDRPHPYVEMVLADNVLYFCGSVRVGVREGRFLDIFILKRVDEMLMHQLSFNSRVKALVSLNSHFVVGTIAGKGFLEWMQGRSFSTSYTVVDELVEEGVPYAAVVQQSGYARLAEAPVRSVNFAGVRAAVSGPVDASPSKSEATLYICTFLALSEYRARVNFINRSILLVSLLVALFTILLSAGLSKAVTDPIRQLRRAMLRLKSGEEPAPLSGPKRGEIADLFRGFNDMAAQIAEDSRALSTHIREITRIKEYNDKIFNSIQEKILVINAQFSVEKANRAFLEYCGQAEDAVLGRNIDELSLALFDEPVHTSIRAIISGGKLSDVQVRRTSLGLSFEIKFYSLFEENIDGPSIHCIMVIEDITAKVAYEEKIRQAEKLASISMLSAGVAHEINNPLSSILTNVQNLIRSERDIERLKDLHLVEQETKRIARTVRSLLDFSSSKRARKTATDINAAIKHIVQLVGYSFRKESGITIELQLGEKLPLVGIGEDECKQIILNLIKNALEAIGTSGHICIETVFSVSESMVQCSVSDTGSGIPKALLPRIFDPFFSTKIESGNSGLGLSVVYGLVSKFKGLIDVESKEGRGTAVRIKLPVAQ